MHRCGKVSDPGWCATCFYRDAVAQGVVCAEQDAERGGKHDGGKHVCACDQKGATGGCWWRTLYERQARRAAEEGKQ